MNIDRNKLLKMLGTLAAICVIVGSLTAFMGRNSMTLSEYAKKNDIPLKAPEEPFDKDTSENKTENLQNESNILSKTTLTGAVLNGDTQSEARVSYKDGFYHEPLSDNLKRYITGVSYPSASEDTENTTDSAITYDELRYLHILYYDFDGNPAQGELICNELIANDLAEIFYELYYNEYRLERVRLIDEYDGDDNASMEDNNTSCFNYRVVKGSSSLSKHALGLAVDINPLYNPYITYSDAGEEQIAPMSALPYADRTQSFPYKVDEKDLAYRLFKEHGFTWGGDWNSCKDYQHFQKTP